MSSQAAARPVVCVYAPNDSNNVVARVPLPAVFTAPIRPDVVHFVHTNMAKNARQAYAVNRMAGHQTAAESWGTGRAVSRIPRVPGGGTHRAGQAAFGNMCRKGRMFAPTRVWRKWHRKINVNQRRYALASALAASALPALVMARGHRIEQVPELPLVLGNAESPVVKTANAVKVFNEFGLEEELERCRTSKKIRAGKGKMRNRRYTLRRGPLVIYDDGAHLEKAVRNLPGVDSAQVERLNLLQLAPGGHVGRMIVWTQSAFEKLDALYGRLNRESELKTGYRLPRHTMYNADLARVINSDEVQSVLRAPKRSNKRRGKKTNPLTNLGSMIKLNPYALTHRRAELRAQEARAARKAEVAEARRKGISTKSDAARAKDAAARAQRPARRAFYESMMS